MTTTLDTLTRAAELLVQAEALVGSCGINRAGDDPAEYSAMYSGDPADLLALGGYVLHDGPLRAEDQRVLQAGLKTGSVAWWASKTFGGAR